MRTHTYARTGKQTVSKQQNPMTSVHNQMSTYKQKQMQSYLQTLSAPESRHV